MTDRQTTSCTAFLCVAGTSSINATLSAITARYASTDAFVGLNFTVQAAAFNAAIRSSLVGLTLLLAKRVLIDSASLANFLMDHIPTFSSQPRRASVPP